MADSKRRLSVLVTLFVGLPVLGLLGLTLLSLLAPRSYFGAPFSDVRWIAGLCALALTLLALLARSPRWAAVAGFLALVHCAPTVWLYWPVERPEEGAVDLRVATVNVWIGNRKPGATCDWLIREDVDIAFLSELSLAIRPELLSRLSNHFPHVRLSPSDPEAWGAKTWGRAIFSRYPIGEFEALDEHGKVLRAVVELEDEKIQIIGAHTDKPSPDYGAPRRDAKLQEIATASAGDPTTIVLGDLNATTTTPSFRELLRDGALRDSRRGFGRQPSWFSVRPIRGINLAIDHVLVGDAWIVADRRIGPAVGSDHYPVIATLVRRSGLTAR